MNSLLEFNPFNTFADTSSLPLLTACNPTLDDPILDREVSLLPFLIYIDFVVDTDFLLTIFKTVEEDLTRTAFLGLGISYGNLDFYFIEEFFKGDYLLVLLTFSSILLSY